MSDQAFFSREYNARAAIPEHAQIFARWAERSARTRASMVCYLDRVYGPSPGETLDIFPARKGDGTALLFIHGGYWRSLDKSDFSFLAPAWVDAGVSLVVVNYELCPKVTIEEIVKQTLRASAWLWLHCEDYGMDQDRLYVSGHSAGAHLTAMMMAAQWSVYDRRLPKELFKGALAVSGLYDLRPMLQTDFLRADLRLDEASALKVSPVFLPPATRAPLYTCVGALESSEFKRQTQLLRERWRGVAGEDIAMPGCNHLTVSEELGNPASRLFAGARTLMKLDR
ncbi:MAG TPA: alpha/beta hydrolase [Burkholderiales bacterium]|nr:alpha/beta hydrolase [Burkholderiales bacterium]